MSEKQQHRALIAASVAEHLARGGAVERLPPGANHEHLSYELSSQARRLSARSSSPRRSRSRWFARGEGVI